MTAVAVASAPLMHPRPEFGGEAPRRRLRSVPAFEQPADGGLDDPLRLGRAMRLRLRDAVQALLADPSIAGLKDAPKLATVVLYAKSRAPRGKKNDNQTSIWAAELGRWMGVGESTVHRNVLTPLRKSDAVHTQVVTNAKGHPTGLDCLVMPLWRARKSGGAAHPLALTKAELATLLRLCEALFGHGWTPEGKEPTLPGLLASRTGKGAVTDRLGLLLMVLNTRASGWLQLCGGSVKKREGRGAATLARLLDCSPSGARKVLARLAEAGVVARGRKATATRMNGRSRVMLLPVARAYGRVLTPVETVSCSGAVFPQRPDGAFGDHAPAGAADSLGTSGVSGAETVEGAGDQERPDGAELHADHASVVTPVVSPQHSCGSSGEGRGGNSGRPDRACAREDCAPSNEPATRLRVVDGDGGPLRGEQPEPSTSTSTPTTDPVGSTTGAGRDKVRLHPGQAPLPPLDLREALEPAAWLWAQATRSGARARIVQAARRELAAVADVIGSTEASSVLAERLAYRLSAQGGEALVRDPVGWLLARGLPRRPGCSDVRCDDSVLMTTGAECPTCADTIRGRQARRRAVAAEVKAGRMGASADELRAACEQRLQLEVAVEEARRQRRLEQAAAAREHREAAQARRRAETEALERTRRAHPCTDCGTPQAAGLCDACRAWRQVTEAIDEAALAAAAGSTDPGDAVAAQAVITSVQQELRGLADAAAEQILADHEVEDSAATAWGSAHAALYAVQNAPATYREAALQALAQSPEAEAEARMIHAAALRDPRRPGAIVARERAEEARARTVRHLLDTRLAALRTTPQPGHRRAA